MSFHLLGRTLMYSGFRLGFTVVIVFFVFAPSLYADTFYRWVDEKGVVHLSDQPPTGAKKPSQNIDEVHLDAPPPQRDPDSQQKAKKEQKEYLERMERALPIEKIERERQKAEGERLLRIMQGHKHGLEGGRLVPRPRR